MTNYLLIILVLTCIGLLAWGFREPKNMLQYPFLAATVFSGWVLPQLVGLSANPGRFPPGALDKTIFMTLLCLVACCIGHFMSERSLRAFDCSFSLQRLLVSATICSLIGSYFFYQVSLLSDDAGTRWSGPITILAFFSHFLTVGLVLATVIHIYKPSRWSLALISFNLIFYIDRIVIHGRRRATVELLIIIGLALWFRYKKLPPRTLIAAILLMGSLWINSVGDYRSVFTGPNALGFTAVTQIDFVGNLRRLASEGGHELTNAVYNIEAFDRRGYFDLGTRHWNGFVHQYIPGQLVGEDIKRNLMIPQDPAALVEFNHVPHTGTTQTGLSDAFQSFWYFGAIKFFVIAYVLRSLHRAAEENHIVAQVLLMLLLVGALEAITHNTDRFYMEWPKIVAFLGPTLWYSKVRSKSLPCQKLPLNS